MLSIEELRFSWQPGKPLLDLPALSLSAGDAQACPARPWQIGALLMLESGLISVLGTVLGLLLVVLGLLALAPWLGGQSGLHLRTPAFTLRELGLLLAVLVGGQLAGIVPALLACRRPLTDDLTLRI